MSQQPAALAQAFCLRHGLDVYLQDVAQLCAAASKAGADDAASTSSSLHEMIAHYLTCVVCGQHVVWRHYSFVSGTHFNRKSFLVAAQRSLLPSLSTAGRQSFGDLHSLLQLLCPDFPASVVKNAFGAAVAIQDWVDYQQDRQTKQQQPKQEQPAGLGVPDNIPDTVQLPVFWQCLEVTFLHEHALLWVRQEAFDQHKRCTSLQLLDAAIQHAFSSIPQHGWPVPAERCWKLAISQASRAGTYPDFAFRDLVRALCCSQELVKAVRRELHDTATAAAATAAALSCACGTRNASSSDSDAAS